MAGCNSAPSVAGSCGGAGNISLSTPAEIIANEGDGFINTITETVDILSKTPTTFSIASHYPYSYEYVAPGEPIVPRFRDDSYDEPTKPLALRATIPAPYAEPSDPLVRDDSYDMPLQPTLVEVTSPEYVPPEELPSRDTAFADPDKPSAVDITPPSGYRSPAVPTFSRTLEIDTTGQPGAAPTDETGASPSVVMPTMPTAPVYTTPEVPTLDGITVPNLTPLDAIDTSVLIPTVDFPDIGNTLDFTNAQWSSADLADMQTHMDRIRNGDFAIGAVIWGQIYDRAAMQLRRDGIAREREGRRAWAKKGWEMPGGVALAQQEQAAFDINSSSAKKALEVAVQEAVQKDDQFWKSVERGVAIEGLYAQAHDAYYERALRFSVALQEAGVAVYNALVARFAVQVQAAEIAITEKRLQIDAQRLTLESDKLGIDAALARGEADKLQLELYQSKWEGVKAAVDVYVAEVTGVKTNVDAQRLTLESFGLEIQHYATKVDAWGKEWSGYESKMRGEQTKASVFDSYVKAYGAKVSSFSAQVGGETARIGGETDIARIQLENAKLSYDKYDTEWRGINAKLDSISKLIASDVAIYESRIRGEDTRMKSLVDIERVKQDAVGSDITRYKADWDGVSTKLTSVAQLTQADVDLYGSKVQNETARIKGATDIAQIQTTEVATDVDRYRADWTGIAAKLDSVSRMRSSDAQIYQSQVSNADAASRATLGQAQISLDFHTNNMQGSIEGAKLALQAATAEAEIKKNAQIATSNLYAQLSAAAMATHSFSYSTSSASQCSQSFSNSASNSVSCNHNITESA